MIVLESGDRVAAAVRQTWIGGRDDAERVVVRRRDVAVVLDDEVAVPAPEVADIHRDARQNFMLHAGRELPVVEPLPPAVQQLGIVPVFGVARPNVASANAPQKSPPAARLSWAQRVQQVAVGYVSCLLPSVQLRRTDVFSMLIGLGPSVTPCHAAGRAQAAEVLVQADLERRLAVAEHVVAPNWLFGVMSW